MTLTLQSYGMCASREELKESDNTCPICQDTFNDPVKLHCKVSSSFLVCEINGSPKKPADFILGTKNRLWASESQT